MLGSIARRSVFRATGIGVAPRSLPDWSYLSDGESSLVISPDAESDVDGRRKLMPRVASTQSINPAEEISILNKQRLNRPNSPHFTIYQPQLTWLASIANRVTGVALSTSLYAFSIAYLLNGYIPVDSASLVNLVQHLPAWFTAPVKLGLAGCFTFHTFNGIRHLAWDMGYGLSLKGVYVGGYTVLAATAISSIYLVFFM